MNGAEEYKEKFRRMSINKVEANSDIKYLEDFYYYIAKKEPTSVYNYINYVINFMRKMNETDPSRLTFTSYNKYTAMIINETPSYQIAVYSALKKFSNFLAANNICPNYMDNVERPKKYERQDTITKREKSVLTKEEVSEMINNILKSGRKDIWVQRDYTIAMLLLTSGIRCSALYKLDVRDIDFSNMTIVVSEKRSNVREIIIPEKTVNEIKKWISYRNTLNLDTNALFVSNQRKRMSARSIYRVINSYGSVNGKVGHPHICRSTYGTNLYDNSGDLYFTQISMGHSNPKTTELYIRGKDKLIKEKAASIIGNIMFD